MAIKINSENMNKFSNFLTELIPIIQHKVQQGDFKWKSNLTDLTPPCRIEIFATTNCAIGVIFQYFQYQDENLVIKLHQLSADQNSKSRYLQNWVDNSEWEGLPYPQSKYSVVPRGIRDPSFRHFLASLTPVINKITTMPLVTPSPSQPKSFSATMITNGALWYLFNIPDLDFNEWELLLVGPCKKEKNKATGIQSDQKNSELKEDLNRSMSDTTKEKEKYFGHHFWPPIWLGNDFWLDVNSYLRLPEFRRINFQDDFIGSTEFYSHKIYFDKQGSIFLGTELTEKEALAVFNNLIFSIKFLIDDITIKGFNKDEVYLVSKEDLCTVKFTIKEKSDSNTIPKISQINKTGSGDRGF